VTIAAVPVEDTFIVSGVVLLDWEDDIEFDTEAGDLDWEREIGSAAGKSFPASGCAAHGEIGVGVGAVCKFCSVFGISSFCGCPGSRNEKKLCETECLW
jgi:hypothetical protein